MGMTFTPPTWLIILSLHVISASLFCGHDVSRKGNNLEKGQGTNPFLQATFLVIMDERASEVTSGWIELCSSTQRLGIQTLTMNEFIMLAPCTGFDGRRKSGA